MGAAYLARDLRLQRKRRRQDPDPPVGPGTAQVGSAGDGGARASGRGSDPRHRVPGGGRPFPRRRVPGPAGRSRTGSGVDRFPSERRSRSPLRWPTPSRRCTPPGTCTGDVKPSNIGFHGHRVAEAPGLRPGPRGERRRRGGAAPCATRLPRSSPAAPPRRPTTSGRWPWSSTRWSREDHPFARPGADAREVTQRIRRRAHSHRWPAVRSGPAIRHGRLRGRRTVRPAAGSPAHRARLRPRASRRSCGARVGLFSFHRSFFRRPSVSRRLNVTAVPGRGPFPESASPSNDENDNGHPLKRGTVEPNTVEDVRIRWKTWYCVARLLRWAGYRDLAAAAAQRGPRLVEALALRSSSRRPRLGTRGMCLKCAVAATALLLLQVVAATAGQNQQQWMVFDRDSASGQLSPWAAISGSAFAASGAISARGRCVRRPRRRSPRRFAAQWRRICKFLAPHRSVSAAHPSISMLIRKGFRFAEQENSDAIRQARRRSGSTST